MKIIKINDPKIIMSNPLSRHAYFGWPTLTRLKNGRLAVVASGFRLKHVCPFGKTVISFSEDEGESYTLPAPVIDTVLDDRDGGILAFGKSGVMVTSFNNTLDFQRKRAFRAFDEKKVDEKEKAYRTAYLDMIDDTEEEKCLGSTFRVSFDNGVTFGKLYKSPVKSPHGPIELRNGNILWVGSKFVKNNAMIDDNCICAYRVFPANGEMEYLGRIDDIFFNGEKQFSCEPFAFELDDGTILCHIRVQSPQEPQTLFTIYQSLSRDGGRTWSAPERILSDRGGAPAHIVKHSSGVLISTYGYRDLPYGIKAMFSYDGGKTWDIDHELYSTVERSDLGYPSTVELSDGSLLTVFYAYPKKDATAVIMQQKWRFEK